VDHIARTPAQLGKILRSCRKLRAVTQKELAAKVGVKQGTVSNAETAPAGSSHATPHKLVPAPRPAPR